MKPRSPRSIRPANKKKAAVEPPQAVALSLERLAGYTRHAKIVNGQAVQQIGRRFFE